MANIDKFNVDMDIIADYRKDQPTNLAEWLRERNNNLTIETITIINTEQIDRLWEKAAGIQLVNSLWDGS